MLSPHTLPIALPPTSSERNLARVQAAYDSVAEKYDSAYDHPKDIAENAFIGELLWNGGFIDGDVLDAGCGTGFMLEQVGALIDPENYVGIDISSGMLSQATKKFPGYVFMNRSMEASGLPAEGFDAVVSLFGCFNYCRADATLADARGVLKPGGRVLFMVCTPRHERRHSYVLRENAPHRRLYTADELKELVAQYFSDVEVVGMSWMIDYLPRWLPQFVFNAFMWLEQKTVARWLPSNCYYLIVTGRHHKG